jgi:hypothetical protein
MPRIVIVVLMYHRYKPVDLINKTSMDLVYILNTAILIQSFTINLMKKANYSTSTLLCGENGLCFASGG